MENVCMRRDAFDFEVWKVLPYLMVLGMLFAVIGVFWVIAEPDPEGIHDHSGNL